jgi:hypothetical protein
MNRPKRALPATYGSSDRVEECSSRQQEVRWAYVRLFVAIASLPTSSHFYPNIPSSNMKLTVISCTSFPGVLAVLTLLTNVVLSTTFDKPVPLLGRQTDSGITSCAPWISIIDPCTAATPSFQSLPFSVEASCLCYSSGLWQPSVYDSAFDECLAYLSTASPAFYSSIGGGTLPTDPCQQAGNVIASVSGGGSPALASPTLTIGPTSTSPSQPANSGACVSFDLIQASCAIATSSFTNLPFTDEASCLCYASGTYAPSLFDGYWGACLAFYSTASPAFYTSLGGDTLTRSPCAEVGNVRSTGPTTIGPGSTPATISSTSTTIPISTILTTTVPTTAAHGNAPSLGLEFYAWLIMVGACFLTLI